LLKRAGLQAAVCGDREQVADGDGLYARYYLLIDEKETAGLFGIKAPAAFERMGMGWGRAEPGQLLFRVELIY
jgi:hypothetical protein